MLLSRLIGAILLISGCCIGAGMLGLPLVSYQAGFFPSSVMLVIAWGFMLATGLLLLEATLRYEQQVNLLTIAQDTLGGFGKLLAGVLFVFLFESLLVAYLSGSAQVIATLFQISPWVARTLSCLLLGGVLFTGTNATDYVNRLLMVGLVLFYFLLIGTGAMHVQMDRLKTANWEASLLLLPTLIISFGFHNLIPSLAHYLHRDRRALILSLVLGSAIPFVIYLFFEYVILGLMSSQGNGAMISEILQEGRAKAHVTLFLEGFSLFAILTSFLGVGLSFIDFLSDGLHIPKSKRGKFVLCLLALLPAFVFSSINPFLFLHALNYAGAFGATLLFGVLPALIIWKVKIRNPILPGGKWTLALIITASIFVFCMQLLNEIGLSL